MATRKNVNATTQVKEFNRRLWICTKVILTDTTTGDEYDFVDEADGQLWKIIRPWKSQDLDGIVIDDRGADPEGLPTPVPPPPIFQDTKSFYYNGVDQGFDSTSNYTAMDNANSYSVSFWVKLARLGIVQRPYGVQNLTDTAFQLYCVIQSNGRVDVGTAGGGSNWSRSTTLLHPGGWNHVCIVCRPGGNRYAQQRIFINGQFGMTSNFSGNVGIGSCGTLSFAMDKNGGSPSDANYNEFAIWTNYDLTDAEVLEVYNNGIPNNLDEDITTPPTSWYREENATFDNSNWVMKDFYEVGPDMESKNMDFLSRENDVPT